MQRHRWQPARLPPPWDSPGKNTGVGCHFLLQCMKVKSESEVAQSGLTLRDPMHCSLPGSSIHGIRWINDMYTFRKAVQLVPRWFSSKESTCNVGDKGHMCSIPGLERYPEEEKGYPLQYSGLENSTDCIVHGVTRSWTQLSDFHPARSRTF